MSLELISTLAAVGTFFVIAATAIAAVIHLRHLRASNQLTAFMTVTHRLDDAEFRGVLPAIPNIAANWSALAVWTSYVSPRSPSRVF